MLTPQNFIHILEYELYVLTNDLFSFRLRFGLGTQKFIRIYERKLKKNKKKHLEIGCAFITTLIIILWFCNFDANNLLVMHGFFASTCKQTLKPKSQNNSNVWIQWKNCYTNVLTVYWIAHLISTIWVVYINIEVVSGCSFSSATSHRSVIICYVSSSMANYNHAKLMPPFPPSSRIDYNDECLDEYVQKYISIVICLFLLQTQLYFFE